MDRAFEIPEGFFLKSKQREIGEADADAVRLFCNLLKGRRVSACGISLRSHGGSNVGFRFKSGVGGQQIFANRLLSLTVAIYSFIA